MKIQSLALLALVVTAALAQSRLSSKDQADPLSNIRVQIAGKYGNDENRLTKPFSGWMTHLTTPDLALSHVQARLGQSDSQPQTRTARIFDMFEIEDLNQKVIRTFVHLKKNDMDPGKCFYISSESDQSASIGDWERSSERCGQDGEVWTRQFSIAPLNAPDRILSAAAFCKERDLLKTYSMVSRVADQTVFALEALATKQLAVPSLSDKATLDEFAIPVVCFAAPKEYNFARLIDEVLQERRDDSNL